MKKITIISLLSIGAILTTVTGISCKKKPNVQNVGDNVSVTSTEDVVKQEESKVEFCTDGNCPCGDGFCAKNSVCIKDMCFCGAFTEKGFIDNGAVASNSFGEFECSRFMEFEQCSIFKTEYNFICTRNEGCKTADGHVFPMMNLSDVWVESKYSLNGNSMYLFFDDSDIAYSKILALDDVEYDLILSHGDYKIVERDNDEFIFYKDLIREHRLNHCGEPLPMNLKYLDRIYSDEEELEVVDYNSIRNYVELDHDFMSIENFQVPSDLECDARKLCNVIGVTPEHINEYVCEIGNKYSETPCSFEEQRRAIGLRCIQPEGCTCGNAHCPEHALCKDGLCTYDIYYQNRVCLNKHWDAAKSDFDNYMEIANNCDCDDKIDQICFNECWFHTDADDDEDCEELCRNSVSNTELCYKRCYWDDYDDTMTKIDPCKKSQ